jgi:hypothetical protein
MKWVHLIESGESTFTSPNITKVVLHLSTGVDTVVPGFSFKARVWWNRLFEPIVAAPETVTDVVVEFSYPAVGPHAREHVSRHINAYWFNLTRVLKNSKVQNVMLINVASVHPDTEEPANPDTFAVPHQNIAKELRDSGLSHVQVMSRDEYKTQVGDKQFKLEF